MIYNESIKTIAVSSLKTKARSFLVTLTLNFSTIMYEGTLNERIGSTPKLMGTESYLFIHLDKTDKERSRV